MFPQVLDVPLGLIWPILIETYHPFVRITSRSVVTFNSACSLAPCSLLSAPKIVMQTDPVYLRWYLFAANMLHVLPTCGPGGRRPQLYTSKQGIVK